MDRIDKINHLIKKEVSDIVHKEVKDPRLEFVTITDVEVTRDLQHSRIYYSVLGDPKSLEAAQDGLDSARGFIRKLMGKRISIRYTPEIEFVFDKSIEYGAKIEEAIERIKNEPKSNSEGH